MAFVLGGGVGVGRSVGGPAKSQFVGARVSAGKVHGVTARWNMADVLIVNAPSGGHAFIGYHLADQLVAKGHEVSIYNAGEEEKATKKNPCASYGDLTEKGVSVAYGDPTSEEVGADITKAFGKKFSVIIENFSKSAEEISPMVKHATETGVAQFLYVSSCGIYKKSDEVPLQVGDPVNEKAGQVAVEKLLESSGLNYSSFRPIYIVGPKAAKSDYLDYFFHRIVRKRPVLLPGSGDQMTSVTHVGDVASMLVDAVGNENASKEIFNVVSPRYVTHSGVAKLCAKATGMEAEIVSFEPDKLTVEVGKKSVMSAYARGTRNQHFFANPGKAMSLLGWESKHGLEDAIAEGFKEFQDSGKGSADFDFSVDDMLLSEL